MTDKPFSPFTDFDFSKFDLRKMVGDLKIPGLDMETLVNAQRKNIEALTAANKVTMEGMQAVAKRQAEILAQALAEVATNAQQFAGVNPQELGSKQMELTRQAFDKAIAHMRELAEMINKTNSEAFELLNRRVTESIEELKALVVKK